MKRALVVVAVVALLGTPSMLTAQTEWGVDIGIGYAKPSGGDGVFVIGTPVDVRVGFAASPSLNIEPRVSFNLVTGSGNTLYVLDAGVNALFAMGSQANNNNRYFTVGANMVTIGDNGGSGFGVNAGIGMRRPAGNGAAMRGELFVGYDFEATDIGRPNTVNFGVRLGFSFWK